MIQLCSNSDWLFSEEAFSIYAVCMYQPTFEAYKKRMKSYASSPFMRIYVNVTDHQITGILVIDRSKQIPEIVGIAVAEQKHGIGKKLILEAMRLERLDRIFAQTDEDAVGFYRKCGFSAERIVKAYPDGVAVRYQCFLSNQ